MNTRIWTLAEDTVLKPQLIAEHGLAMYLATSTGDILFDTGQGLAALRNAAVMGIDLRRVSAIVLSHGHYDHTGGLAAVLADTGPRPVFAHPAAFLPRYSRKGGRLRPIGMPTSLGVLEQAGMELRACTGPSEVLPGIIATGPIPRTTDFETVPEHFCVNGAPGVDPVADPIPDDQALILATRDAPIVVLGCSHAGMINTLLYAAELTGKKRFPLVIGGTHLIEADDARLEKTVEALGQFEINRIAPCHCTGMPGKFALWRRYGSAFVQNGTGDLIECSHRGA